MNKTKALFALAGGLLAGAIALDLWPTGGPHAPPPVHPPDPVPPMIDPVPLPPTQSGAATISLGDRIKLRGALSNGYVQAGTPGELFLRIDLDADRVGATARVPMALAIVIDRSGSMAGDKIEKARQAAKEIVDRLTPEDRLTVVSYATDYTVDQPLTPVTDANRARIRQIIEDILDGGGTNLSGGLEAGLKQLAGTTSQGMVARLVLLSDGNANQGITDPKVLARVAQQARNGGTTISSLGVGVDFNEDLMTLIAESAGGSYHYAKDAAAIQSALEAEFTGMAEIAARQVEVGFELADGVHIEQVYGYLTETRRGRVAIPVGDMRSGEHRQVVLRLSVDGSATGARPVSNVVLAYQGVNQGTAGEFHGSLAVVATDDVSMVEQNARKDVLETAANVTAVSARAEAARSFQSGNKARAVEQLRTQLRATRKKAQALGSSVLVEQAAEIETTLDQVQAMEADSEGGKDLVKSEKLRAFKTNRY